MENYDVALFSKGKLRYSNIHSECHIKKEENEKQTGNDDKSPGSKNQEISKDFRINLAR